MDPTVKAKLREETPGCYDVVHFNNAGSSLSTVYTHDVVVDAMSSELSSGGYELMFKRRDELAEVYQHAATLVNAASKKEISILESATHAWVQIFYSLPLQPGDKVVTTVPEYAANYVSVLQRQKRDGIEVIVAPSDDNGDLLLDEFAAMLRQDTTIKVVLLVHIPTNSGLIAPAQEVGSIIAGINKERGTLQPSSRLLYILDACQSVGQMPVDVQALQCDALTTTSRKYLRGPRNVGFAYTRLDLLLTLEPITIDHHAAAWNPQSGYSLKPDGRRLEKWESSAALRLGLGAAIRYALRVDLSTTWPEVQRLAANLRQQLALIPAVTVRDKGKNLCGIVTFTVADVSCFAVAEALTAKRFNTTVSLTGSTPLDMTKRGITQVCRASVHYYNTDEEVARFCDAVRQCVPAPPPTEK